MIPKIIHYCWFGGGKKSLLIDRCIESWKKYCPDYEIIEWNENNFDININNYVREAYQFKKYAFVSDYLRLYVLEKTGGIYVDCDLEIRKNINCFLSNAAFSSFETKDYIPTAIMGAEKGHPWITELLEYYKDKRFALTDNVLDMTTNTKIITEITKEKYGLVLNNKEQILKEGIHIYPNYVLCNNVLNKENFSVHYFSGSWLGDEDYFKTELIKYRKNYNVLLKVLEKIDKKNSLDFPLEKYNRIYLFGSGNISKYFVNYLKEMKFNLRGIISREDKEIICGLKKVSIDKLGMLGSDDLIIVVPSYDFNNICDELSVKTDAELVSIEYLLDL